MDMQRLLEVEPFLLHLGLEVVQAQPGMVELRLPLRREVANHAGMVHGGAQYALGEATAIALAATVFPERLGHLDLLTANATITYHRPAHGDLVGRASLPPEERDRVRTELGERGRVRFPVSVILTDAKGDAGGEPATTLTVECAARAHT
jgi:uncharacterized protein (TIGR00369 family)